MNIEYKILLDLVIGGVYHNGDRQWRLGILVDILIKF
jgi:hypothetical protein